MNTLWLRVRAPFAAYRWMQAGVYRASSPMMPPSAAYGLLLNIAGVESRDPTPSTATKALASLPALCLALGAVHAAETSVLYQQLHSYPVGNSGKELADKTRGNKFWIAPARREVLVGLDVMVGVRGEESILQRILRGARGEHAWTRYGLPFAGDNNLLIDQLEILGEPISARWYSEHREDEGPLSGSCRLTVEIDREDNSRTRTMLLAPRAPTTEPPPSAWMWVPHAPPA